MICDKYRGKNTSPQCVKTISIWRWQGCQPHTPLLPRKYSWYSFPLETESTPGPECDRKDYVNKKFHGSIGNWTRDLLVCSTVPQPAVPPRASVNSWNCENFLASFPFPHLTQNQTLMNVRYTSLIPICFLLLSYVEQMKFLIDSSIYSVNPFTM
jgi:hypothetical protein